MRFCFVPGVAGLGVYYNNAMLLEGPSFGPGCRRDDVTPQLQNATLPCGSAQLFTRRWDGGLNLSTVAGRWVELSVEANLGTRLWVSGRKLVDQWQVPDEVTAWAGKGWVAKDAVVPVRMESIGIGAQPLADVHLRVDGGNWTAVPDSMWTGSVEKPELQRQELQRGLARSWNTWNRGSAGSHVILPAGLGFTLGIHNRSSDEIISWDAVDSCAETEECQVRPGAHAINGSYTKISRRIPHAAVNYTVESAHADDDGNFLVVLVTAHGPSATEGMRARATVDFFFDCGLNLRPGNQSVCGAILTKNRTVEAEPEGFPGGVVAAVGGLVSAADGVLSASFDSSGRVCFTAGGTETKLSIEDCQNIVSRRQAWYFAGLDVKYPRNKVGKLRDAVEAVRSVVAWNTMWDMRVNVVTPVSRNFGELPYAMWLWDMYFLTLLAAGDSKEVAYSNFIEMTVPTQYGNVPGYFDKDGVGADRSKPYVAAMILLDHFKRFGDPWIVELMFDKLAGWADWVRDMRGFWLSSTEYLIVPGSNNIANVQGGAACSTVHAVWETGLDNSPIYDNITVLQAPPGEACILPVLDVGLNSLQVASLDALSQLAKALGRSDRSNQLAAEGARLSATLSRLLWDADRKIFDNRLAVDANFESGRWKGGAGKFIGRITPTAFYPMLAGVPDAEQAVTMVARWLGTGSGGFCLVDGGSQCQFGLPAVVSFDPAFTDQDYWRGRVWAPMNYLVYRGLAHAKYRHLETVMQARGALVASSQALLLGEWLDMGHVHENYGPNGSGYSAGGGGSNPFHHWGALLGYVAMEAAEEAESVIFM
mmetsp:Transcript_5970/g.14218  ORF Transcript_5970/g.14218 Transcript_5970/m.14218 type:complete len:818 (-) Transcript_5970:126-2579(-)